jgi:fructose-1-phosphate kinase PfkB-like protein
MGQFMKAQVDHFWRAPKFFHSTISPVHYPHRCAGGGGVRVAEVISIVRIVIAELRTQFDTFLLLVSN